MHVAVGRLRVAGVINRLRLVWHGALAFLQARRAEGVVHASVYPEDTRTFWSLSAWTSVEAMLAYRNTGSHLQVMKLAQALGAQVDFRDWEADAVPNWEEARLRLREQVGGRMKDEG